jgi:hypothetical protein
METSSFIPRENKETLRMEGLLKNRVEGKWKVKMAKLPTNYSLDFSVIKDGRVIGLAEAKCRTVSFDTYPTYMISLKKWNAMRQFQASSNLKVLLIVGFTDGDYWVDISTVGEFSSKMGGRSDRDWTVDTEPCVYFKNKYFKELK